MLYSNAERTYFPFLFALVQANGTHALKAKVVSPRQTLKYICLKEVDRGGYVANFTQNSCRNCFVLGDNLCCNTLLYNQCIQS